MREPPPAQLLELLQRLGIAGERDLASIEPNVRRMAGDLPQFQSVWIDALRQAGLLTHFQAREILAERGDSLRVGQFVLCDIVRDDRYASVYKAIDIESRDAFHLTVFDSHNNSTILTQLERLAAFRSRVTPLQGLVESSGQDGMRCWAASRWVEGTTLSEWMLHHGRFPPAVVLEIARAMLAELASIETAGVVHGDIRIENVLLLPDGAVCLLQPGLRGIIRPAEGIAHTDLAPDACSALSPERVTAGRPPTAASDLFACGCVWWQMLCGRPPLGGGDAPLRLRAAQAGAIEDWRNWASDVPQSLGAAVTACLQKDPRKRPSSMAELAEQLGPPRRGGRHLITACLQEAAQPRAPWLAARRKKKKEHPHLWTAATLVLLATIAIAWPLWVASNRPRNGKVGHSEDLSLAKAAAATAGQTVQSSERRRDNSVVPAGYSEAAAKPIAAIDAMLRNNVLNLPGSRTIASDALQLHAGMIVRAERGRARVAVPPQGFAVSVNRVTFENIDFVAAEESSASADRQREVAALVRIASPECAFVGCSFQSAAGRSELSAGIEWDNAADAGLAAVALPSSRIRLKDCVFRRLSAGIVLNARGTNVLEAANVLHVGPGPLLRLTRCPAADESLRLVLSQLTLRESALVECRWASGEQAAPGGISVDSADCAFVPREGDALFSFICDDVSKLLLKEMKWTGQGSVLAPGAAFARWDRGGQLPQPIDDAAISISGLVRGNVQFAAACDGNPMSSRVLDCQAPLTDSDSLGANPANLPPDVPSETVTQH